MEESYLAGITASIPGVAKVLTFSGETYFNLKSLQEFMGWSRPRIYDKIKKVPSCPFDEFFNTTTFSKRGRRLMNLMIWQREGMQLESRAKRVGKRRMDFRPKKTQRVTTPLGDTI